MPNLEKENGTTVLPDAKDQGKEYAEFLTEKVGEINSGIEEFHRLLTNYAETVEHEGLHEQLETLENWMRLNAESMALAVRIFEMGPVWLDELHKRLSLATEELGRLEGEGGPPESPGENETQENQKLSDVWNAANSVMSSMSQLFAPPNKGATH
jgi:hypothetical protein